ncbi:MAG: hypothetical protein J7K77_01720 [Dehalococcoidales bacterium]|nr:hypothetical protein [Dehalococcoidales bacterium]
MSRGKIDTIMNRDFDRKDKMSEEKVAEVEKKIAELEARWPAHSVPPSM